MISFNDFQYHFSAQNAKNIDFVNSDWTPSRQIKWSMIMAVVIAILPIVLRGLKKNSELGA